MEGGREALNDINSTVCNFQSIFMRPTEKSFELTLVNQIIGNKVGEIAKQGKVQVGLRLGLILGTQCGRRELDPGT